MPEADAECHFHCFIALPRRYAPSERQPLCRTYLLSRQNISSSTASRFRRRIRRSRIFHTLPFAENLRSFSLSAVRMLLLCESIFTAVITFIAIIIITITTVNDATESAMNFGMEPLLKIVPAVHSSGSNHAEYIRFRGEN